MKKINKTLIKNIRDFFYVQTMYKQNIQTKIQLVLKFQFAHYIILENKIIHVRLPLNYLYEFEKATAFFLNKCLVSNILICENSR